MTRVHRATTVRRAGWLLAAGLVPALALGCGRTRPPGGAIDGGDGDDRDAACDGCGPGPATITVLATGTRAPLAGVPVAFFDPAGDHLATVETDAAGAATADVVDGSAAAAFLTVGASREGRAVLDLAPGDDVVLAGRWFPVGDPVARMTLVLPLDPAASSYAVQTACGFFAAIPGGLAAGNATAELLFYEGCQPEAFAWVAIASGNAPVSSMSGRDVPLDDGGTIAGEDSWTPLASALLTLVEIPPEVIRLGSAVPLVEIAGQGLAVDLPATAVDVEEATERLELPVVAGVDGATARLAVGRDDPTPSTPFGDQRWWIRRAEADAFERSAAELVLPWLGPAAFDPAARGFLWSQVGDGTWDATYLRLEWRHDTTAGPASGAWTIVAPPGVTGAALPPLPATLADWLPAGLVVDDVAVLLVESSELDGWDAARQRGLDPSLVDAPEALTAPGALRHSASGRAGAPVP